MISPVCCRRDDAEPPNAKINAATAAPTGCQPRSRKNSMSPRPPANRYAKVTKSTARKLGVGSNAARAKCSGRSEEHTSELQSHSDLVCRLLLEKKKKI